MQIRKIDFLPLTSSFVPQKTQQTQANNQTAVSNNSSCQIAYKDYNISFGERLFRTPENFYAQPFNKKGMPQTMKDYINDDYEDRQKMPPAQMLKLVFDDINETKSMEQVKRLYPEEPLFANLNDDPNRKARTGVIAEIDLMRQEGKSLFKNGQDNLGLYILKKIYTEGKTLKEINTDFEKDISVYYKGISPITYDTLSAYGIKFPNNAFWKSFTATREEFPYEYKPRKAFVHQKHDTSRTKSSEPAKKQTLEKGKFDDVKDWEIEKLTDAMIKGNGSKSETEKQIKNRNIRNKESQNFVAKYMGEINSVVMEKLHISPDMKDYFENYDDLTKTQRQKFEEYMKNPHINELRSKVMSSTIRFFFDVYGVDGNNDEFKELLDYAHNIKPERIARQKAHDLLQQEYEEKLGIFDKNESTQAVVEPENTDIDDDEQDRLEHFRKLLDKAKQEYNVDEYNFDTEDGRVTIISNLKEALKESLEFNLKIMPKSFVNLYTRFVLNNPAASDSYILTTLLKEKGVNLPQDDRLMSAEQVEDTTLEFYQECSDKYPIESRAAGQSLADAFIALTKDDITPDLFRLGVFDFNELLENLEPNAKTFLLNKSDMINAKYNEYKRPLSDSEIRKVAITMLDLLRKYDVKKTIIKDPTPFMGFQDLFQALKLALNNNKKQKENFKNDFSRYLKEYGGSARFLLDRSMPEQLKMAKMEQILCSYAYDKPGILFTYSALDKDAMQYLKYNNMKMYDFLKKEVLLKLPVLQSDD